MDRKNTGDRREFLKKSIMAGASLLLSPSLLKASSDSEIWEMTNKNGGVKLKSDGLKITATFLDEISHDIPHQNWWL